MLDAQMAAEQEFMKKREAIRKQFKSSVNRMTAMKKQDDDVGGSSKGGPIQKGQQKVPEKPSITDYRGAYPKRLDLYGPRRTKLVSRSK